MPDPWMETYSPPAMSERAFLKLAGYLHEHLGIKLPENKRLMLQSRILKRLKVLKLDGYDDYCEYVFSPHGQAEELHHLFDVTTTNKTEFFREPSHFEILERTVLPALRSGREFTPERPFVIWSAGCSTGEEPYSLAMTLAAYAEADPPFAFRVMGSDISTRTLEQARLAVYPEASIESIPPPLRSKYLLRSKDRVRPLIRIVPALRAAVCLFRLNLMDRSFALPARPDVIFCRNVVIYFDRPTQLGLVRRFADCLRPGGYLFTGHSEHLCNLDVPFSAVVPTVYRLTAEGGMRS